MQPFAYHRADDSSRPDGSGTEFLAGGTDLLPAMKVGLVTPVSVIDLKRSDLNDTIRRTETGWRLDALATLADVEDHAGLRASIPAIGEAAASAATRQLRTRATIAGNLLQRSRCSYYRDPDLTCWLEGGTTCLAREGRHEHHATVDAGPCISTQPSDLAGVLVALDALVEVRVGDQTTTRPIDEHFSSPTDERRSLNTLAAGEIVTAVIVPAADRASVYLKAMDRAAWQFALVGVAAVVADGGVRLTAGGVAPVPWRLEAVEQHLAGVAPDELTDEIIDRAAALAGTGMEPLPDNRYKVTLLAGLVRQALRRLRSM